MNEEYLVKKLSSHDDILRNQGVSITRIENDVAHIVKGVDRLEEQSRNYNNVMSTINDVSTMLKLHIQSAENTMNKQNDRISGIEARQEKMGIRIQSIEEKPGKKWEYLGLAIIGTIVTIVGALVVTHLYGGS